MDETIRRSLYKKGLNLREHWLSLIKQNDQAFIFDVQRELITFPSILLQNECEYRRS